MREKSKSQKNKSIFILVAAALVISLVSCSGENSPVPPPVQPKAKEAQNEIKEKPKQEETGSIKSTEKDYSYNPNGKVDPFVPLISSESSSKGPSDAAKEKKDIPLTPLQKLDIEDFNLVAVIATGSELKALVEDPVMNGFIVREGMAIGKNDGIIKKILHNSLLVEEHSVDMQGNPERK